MNKMIMDFASTILKLAPQTSPIVVLLHDPF
jgi:hypothetical protein